MHESRRRFLRRGATLVGTGTIAAVSGCSSLPVGGGGGGSTPDYATWLPPASAVGGNHYQFFSASPPAIMAQSDALPKTVTNSFTRDVGFPGVTKLSDYDQVLSVAGFTILEGDLDRQKVKKGLEQYGVSPAETFKGFQLFMSSKDGRTAALSDRALVLAGSMGVGGETLPALKAVVRARSGAGTRYHESDAAVGALVDHLDGGDLIQGARFKRDEGIVGATAAGLQLSFGAPKTDLTSAVVFPEGEAKTKPVETWANEAALVSTASVDISKEGRTVLATGSLATSSVTSIQTEFSTKEEVPQASFGFDYEGTGDGRGTLTITFNGGDAIPQNELFVRGSGFADVADADQTSAGQWQGSASGQDGTVVAGDSVVVGVTSDYEISVVWQASSGNQSTVLSSAKGPDA